MTPLAIGGLAAVTGAAGAVLGGGGLLLGFLAYSACGTLGMLAGGLLNLRLSRMTPACGGMACADERGG